MYTTLRRYRLAIYAPTAGILAYLLVLAGCGSSGNTFTTPSTLTKCAVSFDPTTSTVPAAGGTGSVAVQTERECQWTASPNATWLSITAGTSGQGPGTVEFAAAANIDPVVRTGALDVNNGSVPVTQAAGQCSYQLGQPSASFPQAGGAGSVGLQASSPLCQWSASSGVSWIVVAPPSGKGSASVSFNVSPTTGPPRTGTLSIAGLPFSVTESEGCTYVVAPLSDAIDPAGGAGTAIVTAAGGCPWTAVSNVSWITVASGASGSGNGSVTFTVAAATGTGRSGTLTIAGQVITVTQGTGCTFSLSAGSGSAPAAGATGSFDVRTADGCGWTATSGADWLTVVAGATGTGTGTVQYSVAANPGAGRSGAITAAGQTFTITQGGGCSFAISPTSQTVASGGGATPVAVTAPAGCSWTATSQAPWISVSSGSAGSGNGTVQLIVAPDPGATRTGTVTIAGQTFTVSQTSGCSAAVTPGTIASDASGGKKDVSISTAADCSWTAVSNDPWMTIMGASSGSGNATIGLGISPNTGPARTGTATIAGQTVTVNQDSGCTVAIAPSSQNVGRTGGGGMIHVTAGPGCGWTASAGVPWITFQGVPSGTGNGTVQFGVEPNPTPAPRTGTITIAGQVFTVNQAGS